MENLPKYYVEGNTIFVHAGINEEAADEWKWETSEYEFCKISTSAWQDSWA